MYHEVEELQGVVRIDAWRVAIEGSSLYPKSASDEFLLDRMAYLPV
jgi:hypothetical protein